MRQYSEEGLIAMQDVVTVQCCTYFRSHNDAFRVHGWKVRLLCMSLQGSTEANLDWLCSIKIERCSDDRDWKKERKKDAFDERSPATIDQVYNVDVSSLYPVAPHAALTRLPARLLPPPLSLMPPF